MGRPTCSSMSTRQLVCKHPYQIVRIRHVTRISARYNWLNNTHTAPPPPPPSTPLSACAQHITRAFLTAKYTNFRSACLLGGYPTLQPCCLQNPLSQALQKPHQLAGEPTAAMSSTLSITNSRPWCWEKYSTTAFS